MANSITASGTSRSIFDISLLDITTSGSITASFFKGNGRYLTNINANNIASGVIEVANGGTGNDSYALNGILYKSETNLINDINLTWDPNERKLKINNRDFIQDTSNYIDNTSNKLMYILNTTSNILTDNISLKTNNVSNYVLYTSNVLVNYINKQIEDNSNVNTTVKIGSGLFINKEGVISTTQEITNTIIPTIVNSSLPFEPIASVNYKVCKFIYDSSIGTTFDRINDGQKFLAIWYISSSYNLINDNGFKIKNNGFFLPNTTRLILLGNVSIKPENIENLNIEYAPLNTTYLEFYSPNNTTSAYCNFDVGFNLNNIYIKSSGENSITFSLWLKINNYIDIITIFEFSTNTNRRFKMTYLNNELKIYLEDSIDPIITIPNIYTKRWYHIILSIEKKILEGIINTRVLIDGIIEYEHKRYYDWLYLNGFIGYTINSISKDNNYNYKFSISDFKIYNYSLNITERLELYNTNKYTKYNINFLDVDETICDILAFGGGGGGSSNYGGGAGKLIFINDAYISSGIKTVKIGRGGSGYNSNINNIQTSYNGNNTTFGTDNREYLIADGGGSITYHINNDNTYSNIPINNSGGSGSGNNGAITNFNITNDLYNFLGNTSNIYNRGNVGGPNGGGGVGSIGMGKNAGEALFDLDDISNLNKDTYKFFNYHENINFQNDFNLFNSDIGELYNNQIYIGSGGYGSNNIDALPNIGYNSHNSGSGGNYGENGKNGALLLRVLTKIDRNVIPSYIASTCNYIKTTSNNIIEYINTISNSSSTIWVKDNNNIYFNNNVGIGGQSTDNFKLEVSSVIQNTNFITSIGVHSNISSNIELTADFNANICAKFNSGIWATGNIIASSDERIKTNINDISDDKALQMILNIQPKTYNYIDWINRGNNKIYGFIAQQIKEVIPDAVKIKKEFIPNIFSSADYNIIGNIIILPNNSINIENIIHKNTKVKCYDMNDNIIVVEVVKIINIYSFKIRNINYLYDKIFVYGTEVNDFHVLNKEYINTLNICAVQELHRKIQLQQNEIHSLNDKVNTLIEFIDLSK